MRALRNCLIRNFLLHRPLAILVVNWRLSPRVHHCMISYYRWEYLTRCCLVMLLLLEKLLLAWAHCAVCSSALPLSLGLCSACFSFSRQAGLCTPIFMVQILSSYFAG